MWVNRKILKCAISLKRLIVERNGWKFGTRGHMCFICKYVWCPILWVQFGVIRCTLQNFRLDYSDCHCCMVSQDEYWRVQNVLWLVRPIDSTSLQFFGSYIGFLLSSGWNSRSWHSHLRPCMVNLLPPRHVTLDQTRQSVAVSVCHYSGKASYQKCEVWWQGF